jgi:hypothetical protein
MTSPYAIWQPRYTLTPLLARHLMDIKAARLHLLSAVYQPSIGGLSATRRKPA